MTEASHAVFLSYASQDAEAAQRICEDLRAAGIEVWLDQSELRGGDAWDLKIRQQIRDCALFVPIISVNTASRLEGYFRLEWKLAVDRSHLMAAEKPFLLPGEPMIALGFASAIPVAFRRALFHEDIDDVLAAGVDEGSAPLKCRSRVKLEHRNPEGKVQGAFVLHHLKN